MDLLFSRAICKSDFSCLLGVSSVAKRRSLLDVKLDGHVFATEDIDLFWKFKL